MVFLFPGQGAQYVGMGRGLYEMDGEFAHWIDRAATCWRRELGFDLRGVLYPAAGGEAAAGRGCGRPRVTQPALFVVEYALARLWEPWGVRRSAMVGHSVGE